MSVDDSRCNHYMRLWGNDAVTLNLLYGWQWRCEQHPRMVPADGVNSVLVPVLRQTLGSEAL